MKLMFPPTRMLWCITGSCIGRWRVDERGVAQSPISLNSPEPCNPGTHRISATASAIVQSMAIRLGIFHFLKPYLFGISAAHRAAHVHGLALGHGVTRLNEIAQTWGFASHEPGPLIDSQRVRYNFLAV